MNITTIGLDLAKNVFQVHAVNQEGRVIVRKQLRRPMVVEFFAKLSPCIIGMEAYGSAHHWARELKRLGHDVRLMPPQYVKPYVKRGKNDANDAEAICEAEPARPCALSPSRQPNNRPCSCCTEPEISWCAREPC